MLVNALQNHTMIATAWSMINCLHLPLHLAAISTYLILIIYIGNNTVNENFYSFGVSVGDAQVPVALDGSSPPISLFIPFQFFEASERTLFVSRLLVFIYMPTRISDVYLLLTVYMHVSHGLTRGGGGACLPPNFLD